VTKTADKTIRSNEAGQRLDRIVQDLVDCSRSVARGMFHHECVKLNGSLTEEAGHKVRAGDEVKVTFDPERRYREKPKEWRDRAFRVVFEDKHLIVVDKSAGVLTVDTDAGGDYNLEQAINTYLERAGRKSRGVEVVHRLDRDTSGLLVFAKERRTADGLRDQFRSKKPKREYLAIVAGRLHKKKGTFRSHLTTSKSLFRYSTKNNKRAESAITHYEVVEHLPAATLVRARLETGRRNQIRVHFAEAGHPVLGDSRYRSDRPKDGNWRGRRLALHAATLEFKHPVTGKLMSLNSSEPARFQAYLEVARRQKKPRQPEGLRFEKPRILLASQSPRRLKLLTERYGPERVDACASGHGEASQEGESPTERVRRLAGEKCSLVKDRAGQGIRYIIGADTEVVLDGASMGQPEDEEEARRFLRQLSGRTHSVITGIAIFDIQKDAMQVELAETKVTFRELEDVEIDAYVSTGEPLDKAGAYGIQGMGGQFAEKLDGSYTNVVGLPMELLQRLLAE